MPVSHSTAADGSFSAAGKSAWEAEHTVTGLLTTANNLSDVVSAAAARTNLGLGNVENTALSTWAGSANLVTFGTTRNTMALATGTDAATTMATNTLYIVDMSAWATADRNYTLPASPAVGDRVGIVIQAGNASYELLIIGNTSQTINGGAAAAEWSRLFITGECVILRYVATNKWIVEMDKRIAQKALMLLSTNATAEAANTLTQPTAKGGAWTATIDNASLTTVSTDRLKTRRAGNFLVSVAGGSVNTLTDQKFFDAAIYLNGTANSLILGRVYVPVTGAVARVPSQASLYPLAADDFLVYQFRSEEGAKGLVAIAANIVSSFSLTEVL